MLILLLLLNTLIVLLHFRCGRLLKGSVFTLVKDSGGGIGLMMERRGRKDGTLLVGGTCDCCLFELLLEGESRMGGQLKLC